MKRIVHEEQSQREIQADRQWCEDFVRKSWKPASELRTIEVRRLSYVIGIIE